MDSQNIEITVSPLQDNEELTVTDYESDRCLVQMSDTADGYASVFTAETEREFEIGVDVRQGQSVTVFLVNLFDYLLESDVSSAHLFSRKEVNKITERKLLSEGTYLLGVKQADKSKSEYGFESVLDISPIVS